MLVASLAPATILAADSPDPYAHETPAQRDARMAWWRAARFGMFIHWGVYSVPAGTYNGQRVPGIGEWIMCTGKIPMADYQKFAKVYNPTNYNPDAWVRLAKQAGMKYIVITAKHHDGFANFATEASPWNIVQATPYGQDVLQPLAAACRKYGLKLGFYYSQAQDWNNGGSECRGAWDPAQKQDMDGYIDKVAVPQMRELLTHYGEFPAVLWWDTPCDMTPAGADKLIALLKLKPGIIHNNRLGGGYQGDTETPEQYVPATGFPGRDWETCMTMNDTWGFKSYDDNWKSTATIIRNLVDIASKGGNYLLNVGPNSLGEIPAPSIERLKAVGAWMDVNGEAIYGTTATPFKRLPWGRCTTRRMGDETVLYLHVFKWPADGRLAVPGLKNDIAKAYLLHKSSWLGGHTHLKTVSDTNGATVFVPTTPPDAISSTVVLLIKGAPDVAPTSIFQEADGSVRLMASEADLNGGLQYEADQDNLGYWTNPADTASWTLKIDRPGQFRLSGEFAALAAAKFEVVVGGQKLAVTSPATKDYGKYKRTSLSGTLDLAAGNVTLTIKPVAEGWQPMNVRWLMLQPVTHTP
jgi:alpha-L-fucosidase